jgi:hypothetical protein
LLAELFVNGATTLAAGQELDLGTAFNPAVNAIASSYFATR